MDSASPYSPCEDQGRRRPRKKPLHDSEKGNFVVNVDAIAAGADQRTTLMIRNIPNKYNQKTLLQVID
jgi:hypothetical protein